MFSLEQTFDFMAETSCRASFVMLVFFVIRWLARGRIPARFIFLGWIIVAIRMILPIGVAVSWSPYNLFPLLSSPQPEVHLPLTRESSAAPSPILQNIRQIDDEGSRVHLASPIDFEAPLKFWKRRAVQLWIGGVAVLFAFRIGASLVFKRRLRGSKRAPEGRFLRLAKDCAGVLRICTPLEIKVTAAMQTPAIQGLLRPRLLFPVAFAERLTDEELRLVLLHELGHWQRRDLLAHRLLWAARLIHWFNPLVWLAARFARLDCELACDEFVMRRTSPSEQAAYGATLLKVLGMVRGQIGPPAILGILEHKQQLKERIQMIASYKSASIGRIVLGGVLLGVLAIVSITRETRAQETTVNFSAGRTTTLPRGWQKIGNREDTYLVGIDRTESHLKPSSVFIKSGDSSRREDFGGLVQVCSAENYIGKKVRLSAWIKTAGVSGTANLLLRADGSTGVLRFDDLGSRAPAGSTPWTYYSAVLDIPEGAVNLAYGLFIKDKGEAWFNNVVFEELGSDEEEADRSLQEYRSRYNMGTMEENKSVLLRKIGLLGTNIVTLELDQVHLKTTLLEVDDYLKNHKDVLEIGAIRTFGNISSLKVELENLKAQRGILADKYTESHPRMVENGLAIMGIEKRIKDNIDLAVADLREQCNLATQNESRLRAELSKAEGKAREFDKIANEYKSLVKKWETKKATLQRTVETSPKQIATGAVAVDLPSADRKSPENLVFE